MREILNSLLGLLARADVLADATIALEYAGLVEHRFAADADPDLLARFVQPAQLQVMERLARIENRHMRGPFDRGHVKVVQFPVFLPDKIKAAHIGDPFRAGAGKRGEPVVVVLFPVQIR